MPAYLSATEEEELSTHLLDASKIGYGKTRRVRGRGSPSLRLRATAGVRMDAINAENMRDLLRSVFDHPERIYKTVGTADKKRAPRALWSSSLELSCRCVCVRVCVCVCVRACVWGGMWHEAPDVLHKYLLV